MSACTGLDDGSEYRSEERDAWEQEDCGSAASTPLRHRREAGGVSGPTEAEASVVDVSISTRESKTPRKMGISPPKADPPPSPGTLVLVLQHHKGTRLSRGCGYAATVTGVRTVVTSRDERAHVTGATAVLSLLYPDGVTGELNFPSPDLEGVLTSHEATGAHLQLGAADALQAEPSTLDPNPEPETRNPKP